MSAVFCLLVAAESRSPAAHAHWRPGPCNPRRSYRTYWAASMASVPRNSMHRFMVLVDLSIKGRMIRKCCPEAYYSTDDCLGLQLCNPSLWIQNQRLAQSVKMELVWQQIWQGSKARCSQGQLSQRQGSNCVVTKSVIKSIKFSILFFSSKKFLMQLRGTIRNLGIILCNLYYHS